VDAIVADARGSVDWFVGGLDCVQEDTPPLTLPGRLRLDLWTGRRGSRLPFFGTQPVYAQRDPGANACGARRTCTASTYAPRARGRHAADLSGALFCLPHCTASSERCVDHSRFRVTPRSAACYAGSASRATAHGIFAACACYRSAQLASPLERAHGSLPRLPAAPHCP